MSAQGNGAGFAAEESLLGGLLLDATAWPTVSGVVRAEDLSRPDHRLIFEAIAALAREGNIVDHVLVAERLQRDNQLDAAGGLAYLSALSRGTPTAQHVAAYAQAVRDRALRSQVEQLAADAPEAGELTERLEHMLTRLKSGVPADRRVQPIKLRHIADIVSEHSEPEWLNGLADVLERKVQAVLAGSRNTLKSFIATHWALTAALAGESVVILSAEGSGLGRRVEAWMKLHAPARSIADLRLLALERRVNLNSAEVLAELRTAIDAASFTPGFFVVDTLSKYAPGLDENDNAAVAAFLATQSEEIRDFYRATELLVVHAGHGDAKRPRGASVLMANPDAEYIVERASPTAMTVTVSRERFKDCPSLPPLAYAAEVIELGRTDKRGHPVTSLALRETAEAAVAAATPRGAELRGRAQRQLLAAVRAHAKDKDCLGIWTLADLREIGRKAGQSKTTARDAAEALATSPFMVPSIGGLRLADA